MKEVELYFHGYTWEEYAYQIIGHPGIYVVYGGHLDSEGFVVMHEVLYIGYHKRINELFENGMLYSLKHQIKDNERLFFSYTDVMSEEEGNMIAAMLVSSVNPKKAKSELEEIARRKINKIVCKGKCDLLPNVIIG